jgi:hypothetical protein
MISPEKQTANQANAQYSTGPKTPEGKARSAANSRTHGFCSKENLVAAEDQEEFDEMAHSYQVDLSPDGAIEQTLSEEIVAAAWQLRRMRRVETEVCAGHDSYTAILDDDVLQKKLDRLARHKTRIERTFHRCLKQFKTIQNERYEQEIKFQAMLAQQNSERTQPAAEPGGTGLQPVSLSASEPLPADYAEKINREFEEIDRGLAQLGCFATPPTARDGLR